jgi:NADPH2 dehydrogenase
MMRGQGFVPIGHLRDIAHFQQHLESLAIALPCDREIAHGAASPVAQSLERQDLRIGNRIAVHPMEGWDGAADGNPGEGTLRRWRRFGSSGAKLIWGGEAVAVRHDGRANPNQLVIAPHTERGLARLREILIEEHRRATGSDDGLVIGLQLTHSGRYSRPDAHNRPEPKILYHHPILDRHLGLPADFPVLTDSEIGAIIEDFHRAARIALRLGFDFVDIKHCHGYLGHEFLSAHTRAGRYGGSFENRTRFLCETVEGVRAAAPGLKIGVRVSAFDLIPFRAAPASAEIEAGIGEPEPFRRLLPYRWGFGVDQSDPARENLAEPARFLALLEKMDIRLVNLTAGSPYYNPHLQRPAAYPPSDGYRPPADPLIEVARQMNAVRALKQKFPGLIIVGTAYSYLQDYLPNVAQAAIRTGWTDFVGLGRMVLSYPEILLDAIEGRTLQHKRVCRTFSDCTTAPRNGLPSGCYPLDSHYKRSEMAARLRQAKARRASAG